MLVNVVVLTFNTNLVETDKLKRLRSKKLETCALLEIIYNKYKLADMKVKSNQIKPCKRCKILKLESSKATKATYFT